MNLRYLTSGKVRWIGVEPNPFMEPYLREEANRLSMPIELHIGTAETLPIADNSVDAAIATLVLCCVNIQHQSLQEALRVLRPGGRLVFIEHLAPRGSWLRPHSEPADTDLEAAGVRVQSQSRNMGRN